ncbi:hypothetical protein JCM8097_002274 [Rhodosporidiobolus ruineniae]
MATLQRRNFANASGAVTATAPSSSSSSASASPSATSSGQSAGTGTYWGVGSDGNFSAAWVTWVSIIIVAGVVFALLLSRFFYIRRYYPPTFRSYFIPSKGLHIPLLRIHIAGPPPREPREPPPSYYATTGRRRRRRHRQTVGETVGAGGTRLGGRDEDDGWDDDAQLDMAERGATGGLDMLPAYFVDVGLPGYTGGGAAAEEADRIRAEAATRGEGEVLPTAAEYEAASRSARDASAGAGGEGAEGGAEGPTYPPVAHLSSTAPSPTSRPAPVRSLTARSTHLLSSLPLPFLGSTRAPSPSRQPSSLPSTPTTESPPRASSSSETLDSSRPDGVRRTRSSASSSSGASGASGSTAATKRDEDAKSVVSGGRKGKEVDLAAEGAGAGSSSSSVRLAQEEKPEAEKEEEKVEHSSDPLGASRPS